jgi:hypothetical protein
LLFARLLCQQAGCSMAALITQGVAVKNAISWFEIPCHDLARAQVFYEDVLACRLRREAMGPSEGAVFPYEGEGVGGCLMAGPSAPQPAPGGVLVYLDCSPSLDAALARDTQAGGRIALPRQALPPGMGFFAHIIDPDGNRLGLHAPA